MTARRLLAAASTALLAWLPAAAAGDASPSAPPGAASSAPGSAAAAARTATARPAAAATARTCTPPHYPSVGYFDALTVTGTTCATGDKLVLAYYRCRTKAGGPAGRCHRTVLGFTCTETRDAIPTEIDARDKCRHGRETVVSVWQQDVD
jgi:hypothetical protein